MHKSFESAESFEHIKPYKQSLRESNEQYQIEPLSGDSQSSNPERRNFKLFLIIFLVVESVIFLSLFSSYFNTPLILEPLSEGILKEAKRVIDTY